MHELGETVLNYDAYIVLCELTILNYPIYMIKHLSIIWSWSKLYGCIVHIMDVFSVMEYDYPEGIYDVSVNIFPMML